MFNVHIHTINKQQADTHHFNPLVIPYLYMVNPLKCLRMNRLSYKHNTDT